MIIEDDFRNTHISHLGDPGTKNFSFGNSIGGYTEFGVRKPPLVEHAWIFYMYYNVASNFYYDFLNTLRKL